jgi:hypothetical protein
MEQSDKAGQAADTSLELPLHVKRLVWERSKQVFICMQTATVTAIAHLLCKSTDA